MHNQMILVMSDKCDLKSLSLQLYGKEIEITLAENSASHRLYGITTLKGILVGRLWGDKILSDGSSEETVIALVIAQGNKEIEIPCKDIDFLK
jgi:hypothetical protein